MTEALTLINLGYTDYHDAWIDYINNFLTLAGFADYHGITKEQAQSILDKGQHLNNCI